ncbi:MAG TPA: TorF family putative porin [Tardiphaga sp.]
MKKTIVSVAALLAIGLGSASAADLGAKIYKKAPPIVAFDPWDIAFGSSITNDYVFRGITQSNHKPSVTAYFEPRYNVTKDVQLYAGVSASSISFTNRASAELDGYFGVRPTWGPAAFDFGFWYYGYPGGQCIDSVPGGQAGVCGVGSGANALLNGNVLKKNVSFYEGYAKVNYTFNDNFSLGANAYYTPSYLNSGAEGTYASITGKVIAPSTWFGSTGIGSYVSGEFGRQWLGTTSAFYSIPLGLGTGGIKYPDYNTWNIGIGFTYKVFTLDLRYSDTNISKGDCNAFTGDFTAPAAGTDVTAINPFGGGSNWCGATGIVKLSADLTAMTNLK